jgi:hypothetical protein
MGRSKRYVLGLLLAGCNGPLFPGTPIFMEDQDSAVRIVWQESFGREDAPPEIRWVSPEGQNCITKHSVRPGFKTIVGCVEGLTMSPNSISVSWHEGDTFSATVLAHELVHAAQARRLVFDSGHHTAEFQPGGAVDQANGMLSDAGL